MRFQYRMFIAILITAHSAGAGEPTDPPAFTHARVTDAWEAYRDRLSFGKGQTLALVDDGCTLSMPEWSSSDGEIPKVLVSYDSVDGDDNPQHEGKGYHGSTIGIPSSVNHAGKLGVAFNDQVAVIRALECCHCSVNDSKTLAAGLRWVIDHHREFRITTVNLAPVDDLEHGVPVPTEIDAELRTLRELGIWVSAPAGNHAFVNGISWPACQPFSFAIGAVTPGKDSVYLDRHAKVDLLVPAAATSSSNAIACGAAMLLREAIEKTRYDWKQDASNLPEAMLKIMQKTGAVVEDPPSKLSFRRLDVKAALDFVFQTSNTAAFEQVIPVPLHPASRLADWKLKAFTDGVLTFEVSVAGNARLVLKSVDPLLVEEVSGGTATLRPGWDGTIEYSHYGLELSAQAPGEVIVRLRTVLPPAAPIETSDEDLAQFRQEFANRSSRPPEDAREFRAWQDGLRLKLTRTLMGSELPQRVPLEPRVTDTKDHPNFTLQRVEYRTLADRRNVLLLSLPKSIDPGASVPLLLALHGHEADWGKADEGAYQAGHNDDFMAYFAERGWAVLQPATMNHTLQHAAWTLQGEWTWDAIVALDYAATLPKVDMNRVGVCGLSTGAHLAMNVLALDDRARAGVVGCVLSTWHHYEHRFRIPPHCDCGIHHQLSSVLEQCDWAALMAPKPVQFQHGRQDAAFCPGADRKYLDLKWNTGVMPQAEYDSLFVEVRRAWALAGKSEVVETRFHNGPHKVDNQAGFEWLEQWVKLVK